MFSEVGQQKSKSLIDNVQIVIDTGFGHSSMSASVAPPLETRITSHTTQVTEPPMFNGTIHIPKDGHKQTTLSISTDSDNRSDAALSTVQHTNIAGVPERLGSAGTEDSFDELETPMSDAPPLRTGRVRFRSRVRITSGLNRRKQKPRSENDYMTFSPSSSLSGSPSSSISAPLRTQEDDVGKPGWGTLGQRVSMFVHANSQRTKPRGQQERTSLVSKTQSFSNGRHGIIINERTPLTDHLSYRGDADFRSDDESNLLREIELVFGPWPNRLLNHHWWWWHLEHIVCCHCLTETDDEG